MAKRNKILRFEDFKARMLDVWYWTKQQKRSHHVHLGEMHARLYVHPDWQRLTRYERGYLKGIDDTLWGEVSRNMVWLFPVDGERLTWEMWRQRYPEGDPSTLQGKHYWPNSDREW